MESHLKQAWADFEQFLAGTRAPALIAHSLATIVAQPFGDVGAFVARWSYTFPNPDPFTSLMHARTKVFDIFFYRVVRFQRIYSFFDGFERSIVELLPPQDATRVRQLFAEHPWREIRPLGSFREMTEYALEKRRVATVNAEGFNSELYKNATHQILAADRRYTFADEAMVQQVGEAQAKVSEVFDDFVGLIKDPNQKREILIANAADKDAVYGNKPRFELENYLCQLADFAIALFNDDYCEHGVQIFNIVRGVGHQSNLDLSKLTRFQDKVHLFHAYKLGEFGATKHGALLLRTVLPLYNVWQPETLLQTIGFEEDRRARRLALTLFECYGRDAYSHAVSELFECAQDTPWYYPRNLAYILGRIVTDREDLRAQAVTGLEPFLGPDSPRQLNLQVIQALGFIGTPSATSILADKLDLFGGHFATSEAAAEICHKIVAALIASDQERGIEAAFDFCLAAEVLPQYRDSFARAHVPESVRARVVALVRKEMRKLKLSFSFLGDTSSTRVLLSVLGHSGYPDVDALCRDIVGTMPAKNELVAESNKILSTPPPPGLLAPDRLLHRLLSTRDLPQMFCHAYDAGTSGRIEAKTREGVACFVDLRAGSVLDAAVPAYDIASDNAFFWTFLLEGRDLASLRYLADGAPAHQRISVATADLLRDALFQRGEVVHIVEGVISPESKFRRRTVHPYYTKFTNLRDGQKYKSVWDCLASEVDLKAIRAATQLSRRDIYRILFYFKRNNMLVIDGDLGDEQMLRTEDALATIDMYVRRIQARPVLFASYHAAADACGYLERSATDAAVAGGAKALRAYFGEAYTQHRVFSAENVDVCIRTLDLLARYAKSKSPDARRELVEYVSFTFQAAVSTDVAPLQAPAVSELERIENLEGANDPFDAFGDLDEESLDEMFDSIDSVLNATGFGGERSTGTGAALSEYEESALLELFGNIANEYVKPLKDLIREVKRNSELGRTTTTDWLDFAAPSVKLLVGASEKMGYERIHRHMARVESGFEQQRARGEELFGPQFCQWILAEHEQLARLLPTTFALTLTPEELAAKKDGLIVKFILRQIPEVTERVYNKLIFAGLNVFDRFTEIPPDEIAHVTGIEKRLAETIYMKFYQYQDLYYFRDEPNRVGKLASLFDISLSTLKEVHAELERLPSDDASVDPKRRQVIIDERQRSLWAVFVLLCIRGEHELIERLQRAPFDERLALLDDYYSRLMNSGFALTA
jgi:hypothetical protein